MECDNTLDCICEFCTAARHEAIRKGTGTVAARLHPSHKLAKPIKIKRLPPPVRAVKPSPGQSDLF